MPCVSQWTTNAPGCAVGVCQRRQDLDRESLWHGRPRTRRAEPAGHDFRGGSVSKQFTAAAVLLLARDGKLSLDDPIRKYVPEVPDYGTPITIRQMLQHTSGPA
jgi:CubicO group peptidase (beta-lactamase class C family)